MAESLSYRLGRLAASKLLKAKWMWQAATGSEADAIRAEYRVGRAMAQVVREETPCDADPEMRAWLRAIQARLVDRVRNRSHQFDVTAIEGGAPTAFALPGGFIFVARSLVDLCERNGDEIGFVVAHEMAHVIRRHAIDRLLGQAAISTAALASPARGALGGWIRKLGLTWLERAYSREQEFEADELAGLLMRAAGLDPAGAIRVLHRLARQQGTSGDGTMDTYLSTHPPIADRIARLRERLHLDG